VKFDLVPPHAVLHTFKVFIDDLSHYNIDSISILLETCGRYAFREEKTAENITALVRWRGCDRFG
jgi:regulator of nonsense transcripts 2